MNIARNIVLSFWYHLACPFMRIRLDTTPEFWFSISCLNLKGVWQGTAAWLLLLGTVSPQPYSVGLGLWLHMHEQ